MSIDVNVFKLLTFDVKLVFGILPFVVSFFFEAIQTDLQVVLFNYLTQFLVFLFFYRSKSLSAFFSFPVTEFNDFVAPSSLLPAATIICVVEINEKKRMQEVHERIAFVKFAGIVHWQVKELVCSIVCLINFNLELLLGVLIDCVNEFVKF